ncbi:AAA family ATPase [Planococcus salinus]|uniref:Nuclease SbcCD subunit C n=1 Tax=Planococcus salinus TaxID=1848460 RepID=A0A3M8P784_9BACL|nr:SMC family ATPase [Planococcus salinus]RNF39140.1 SMC family ATPase [Planococcus salinus]
MRPLKLKMTAFGPYKETEIIDFKELKGNQLFVISGSTGSGKTTIFDGICFALFGSASGSDRSETRNLRSDFADDSTPTCVEMEFEIHNRKYRILRQMGHVKKGNKSATGERYEFFIVDENGETPCVERQIVSEINPKVEQILGLTQNQFSQIVMLPQGEFRKLLTSETDNKEEILRRIFKTEPYKMISERLKQKKDAAAKSHQLEEQLLDNHIQAIQSSLPMRESELFEVMSREHANIHQILAGLEKESLFYKEKADMDQARYQSLYKKHNDKLESYHEAQKWNSRFAEMNEKEQQLEYSTEQLPVFAEKEQVLQQAERAGLIQNSENLFRELLENEVEKNNQLTRAAEAKKTAAETKEQAEQQFSAEEKRSEQRENARKQVIELQGLLPQVQELAAKEAELVQLEAAAEQSEKELLASEELHAGKKEATDSMAGKIRELEQVVESYDEKQRKLTKLHEQVRVATEYLALLASKATQSSELAQKESLYLQSATAYSGKEASWFADQAHILAEQLHDGEACPVCGSHEHPNKKTVADKLSVSKEELEKAKSERDKLDGQFRNAAARLASIEEQLAQKKAEVEQHGVSAEQAETEAVRLEELKQQLANEVRVLQTQKQELRDLKEQLSKQLSQLEKVEQDKAARLSEMNKQKSAFQTAKAVVAEKYSSIPEKMRALPFLKAEIQQAVAQKEQLERSWDTAQKQYQKAKEQMASAAVSCQHAKASAEEITEKRAKAEQQFKDALEKSAFESEQAYHRAKMHESDFADLKREIQQFNQTHHTLQQQVKELTELLKDRKNEDVSLMEVELADLKQGYEQSLATWNHSMECGKKADELMRNIQAAIEKTAAAEQQLNRIADLHNMIRGQNDLKISFERYLQIEYLEQIIQSANERLKNLSNGQFYLMRSDRQESRGKQSGLGLDVYDAYTGQTRDVKTLSGGEKFNASLCLALGMADVIQSFQGNVSIETMFIDEGFGSLDEESLNKSIDTLIDLQKSGRMIGVISHVRELKAAIPAILEVEKSKEGCSRTKFLVR